MSCSSRQDECQNAEATKTLNVNFDGGWMPLCAIHTIQMVKEISFALDKKGQTKEMIVFLGMGGQIRQHDECSILNW